MNFTPTYALLRHATRQYLRDTPSFFMMRVKIAGSDLGCGAASRAPCSDMSQMVQGIGAARPASAIEAPWRFGMRGDRRSSRTRGNTEHLSHYKTFPEGGLLSTDTSNSLLQN